MTSRSRLVAAMLCAVLLVLPAGATYAGDKPLATAFAGEMHGGYVYSVGNSTYSGTIVSGGRYAVSFSVDLPDDAIVRYQRYYMYWAWSRRDQQAVYPSIAVTCCTQGELPVAVTRFVDSKGVSGPSDFFSGMDTFAGGNLSPGKNAVTFEVANTGEGNSTFVIQGAGLLAVYESPSEPQGLTLVSEGCDMLYNSYGITPEMATSRVEWDRGIDLLRMKSATIELAAPSGGYTRSDVIGKNAVYMNRAQDDELPTFLSTILNLVFPESRGKEWDDVFLSDSQQQIGIETLDVTPYMAQKNNFVAVQDRGDYLLLTNAILRVDYS
jgi:hypothetical protein